MANIALLRYYKRLLDKHQIEFNEIPSEIQRELKSFEESLVTTVVNEASETTVAEVVKPQRFGAITISDPLNKDASYNGAVTSGLITVVFTSDELFTDKLLDGKPYPEDLSYDIKEVEYYSDKAKGLAVTIESNDNGAMLKVSGIDEDIVPFKMRVDLMIHSSNYEDMRVTLYPNIT